MKFVTLLSITALGSSSHAALISINLTNTNGPRQIGAAEATGVVSTTGWLNISALTNADVGGSGIDVTLSKAASAFNTARDAAPADGTDGFLALYEAGLRDSTAGTVDTTVTISNMTAYLASQSATSYRIITYYKTPISSGVTGINVRVGGTAGTGTFVTSSSTAYTGMSASDSFTEVGNTSSNWMDFTGLTSDTAVIELDRSTRDGLLTGFQIETISVPEPTSTALLGLGGLALILRRRN